MAVPKNPLAAFIWGAGGAALTPEELARRREMEEALLAKQGVDTSPVGHWTQGLARVANAAAGAYRRNKLDGAQTENDDYNKSLVETLFGRSSSTPASDGAVPMTDGAAEVSGTAPTSGQPIDMTGNEIYDQFMGTVKEGVTNPYALAAVAATAKAESGFDPGNVNRTWSDPSESGQAGTAGGLMSWRGPRYEALAATGDLSPAGQARFFLGEDPALIEKLNGAQSVEEAQSLMNNAWKFAGYNRPGGEAANRLAAAQSFLPTFQAGGEVAAVSPEAAIEAVSPLVEGAVPVEGASLADEVAQFEQTPEYASQFANATGQPMADTQFDDRFGQTALPVEQVTGRDAVAKALMEQQSQLNPAQAAITDQATALPTADAAQAAVTGGQPVEMAQAATGQQGLGGIPTEELLRVLTDPRANANTRAVAQALMQQQEAAQRQQAEQQIWMQRQQYERQQQEQDPLRQLQIQKGQLELDALRNPTAKETAQMQNLTWRAKEAGLQPGTPEYADFMRTGGTPTKDTNITVNTGEGGKFYEALDKKNAEMFATLSDEGIRGRSKLAQIDRLDQLLASAPDGGGAALKMLAGEYGINTEGLQDLQAAQALINELVPQQRQPGSGPMSDADLALFKQSLPRIINQPDGNKMIMQTMRGITEYQVKMGEIADAVADRTLTPEQGRKAIRTLENPLEGYTKAIRQLENDDQDSKADVPEGLDPKVWEKMPLEDRALWK